MDYVEAFENLKPNEKYGRKTPHKAVLLLTIIEMCESDDICSNEIRYNQLLIDTFHKVWKRTLPDDDSLFVDAYFPFWTMQNEDFWHLVPFRGKEEYLNLLKERQIRPSESKIKECVDYVELDEDLFFLMSLPSGRSSLKRALLENYSALTEEKIGELATSKDNAIDKSIEALAEYQKILSSENEPKNNLVAESCDEEKQNLFYALDEDVQIQLNIEYYTFLKEHKAEREMFRSLCPTVFDLYDKISAHPVKQEDITSSLLYLYENFLLDLKVNLLGVDATLNLVDCIEKAINQLHAHEHQEDVFISSNIGIEDDTVKIENSSSDLTLSADSVSSDEDESSAVNCRRKDLPWTENEEELLLLCYEKGKSIEDIASILGRSQNSITLRLVNLGKLKYDFTQSETAEGSKYTDQDLSTLDYYVENMERLCFILNRNGECVYSTDGKLKILHGKLYRFNYKDNICFTVKDMVCTNGVWDKGKKTIVAYMQTDLFPLLDRTHYLEHIEDLQEGNCMQQNKIRVDGKWYDFDGNLIGRATEQLPDILDNVECEGIQVRDTGKDFVPKAGLELIATKLCSSYDYLWLMSIVDLVNINQHASVFYFDEIACMMITEAWWLLDKYPHLKTKNESLVDCIEFLINESEDNMEQKLGWSTPSFEVYSTIKDYPMSGIFEDLVDELVEESPANVLRLWLDDKDERDLVLHSANYVNRCLYSLHLKKFDSFIEVNPIWKKYLRVEQTNLLTFMRDSLVAFLNR